MKTPTLSGPRWAIAGNPVGAPAATSAAPAPTMNSRRVTVTRPSRSSGTPLAPHYHLIPMTRVSRCSWHRRREDSSLYAAVLSTRRCSVSPPGTTWRQAAGVLPQQARRGPIASMITECSLCAHWPASRAGRRGRTRTMRRWYCRAVISADTARRLTRRPGLAPTRRGARRCADLASHSHASSS